ncbi:hypothetical protein, partial [Thiolapillus sp.]|uniref:hypothetical protein n=1 Tax=Thiolapillus sp. TaxID=2017437 RepID=UPI003AF4ED1C
MRDFFCGVGVEVCITNASFSPGAHWQQVKKMHFHGTPAGADSTTRIYSRLPCFLIVMEITAFFLQLAKLPFWTFICVCCGLNFLQRSFEVVRSTVWMT